MKRFGCFHRHNYLVIVTKSTSLGCKHFYFEGELTNPNSISRQKTVDWWEFPVSRRVIWWFLRMGVPQNYLILVIFSNASSKLPRCPCPSILVKEVERWDINHPIQYLGFPILSPKRQPSTTAPRAFLRKRAIFNPCLNRPSATGSLVPKLDGQLPQRSTTKTLTELIKDYSFIYAKISVVI